MSSLYDQEKESGAAQAPVGALPPLPGVVGELADRDPSHVTSISAGDLAAMLENYARAAILADRADQAVQHIGAFTGELPEHVTAKIACLIEREIDNQLQASGMSPRDMQRQDGDEILSIVLDELAASGCISLAGRFRAQGGNTKAESSDRAAIATTQKEGE